ncbi:LacI family transcriptional regulator [Planomonospora parontospora subsp. parontospora]|uniref:LacI family transcriptional regulator n=2 Tax=Planomonospora parontospora TaxID=58119 RepID=A0AA37BFN0_9ACTN|nr:LacI family DNA-binding transcriptional regulator [Planomonospora parontospora]GGK64481.1 LacI family transcriptional regulator [Planomonospora parontospora]GII08076.1 LacI family transcriptional regulator [Planomonospora parontospora subsp. parontospora]
MTARPTLEKVAARAGVSRATVSRVVNGSTHVNPEIRATVMRAVEELGYVPNLAARSLVTRRADSVALVFSEPPTRVFSDDPMFASIIRGVGHETEASDKHLVLMLAGSPRGQERIERYTTAGHVDGVIVASMHGADPLPAALARRGVPVVCSGRPLQAGVQGAPPCVDVENVGGAEQAVGHLVAVGRRRIATIAGPQDMVAGIDRLTGYRNVLRDSDRRSIVAVGDFTRESGVAAMRQLLRDDPGLDAVFAASDMMALGALQALRQAGRRVPDDVAVVGFDDVPAAAYAEPPLTTVRQPLHEMGRELARLVLALASGQDAGAPVILPTELVVRDSA